MLINYVMFASFSFVVNHGLAIEWPDPCCLKPANDVFFQE